ncbi:MAG: hypothetical protein LW808_002215 [Verrucomicrobiota bacterium]|nr:MAG: hypothetical protein LW808_002215 [Verrucomicrobiota bacterium]
MKVHLLKKLSLFIGITSSLFAPLHADTEEEARSVEELRWAVEQLTIIIQGIPEANWGLRAQAIQRRREILRQLHEYEANFSFFKRE